MEFAVPITFVAVVAVLAILRVMGKLPLVRGEAARRLVTAATILSASAVVVIALLVFALTR